MGVIIKQSFKASIVSYLGIALGAFNSLYLFPKLIGAEGIGLINVISASSTLFLPVLQLGFNTSLVKYFPSFKEKPFFSTFITYGFIIPLFALFVFVLCWPFTQGIFSFLFKERAALIFDNISYVVPLTGILVFFGLFESYARANYKTVFPAIIRNLIWRSSMTIGISAIGFGYIGYENLVQVLIWSWLFCLIIIGFYSFSSFSIKFGMDKRLFSSDQLKAFNCFSGYVILVSLGGRLIQLIDQLMVASLIDTNAAGVFSTAMYFATLIEIPKRTVINIAQPVLVDAFKNGNDRKVNEIYKKSSLNLLLIGGIIFVFIWINVFDIFEIIPRKEEFMSGIYVVFFYGLARVIDMGMGCNNEIIIFSKYYKVNLPLQFLLVGIVMATNMIFIPKYNITGAALATFVSVATYNLIRFIYIIWRLKMQPFSKKTPMVLIVLIVFTIIGVYLPVNFESISDNIIKSLCNIIVRSIVVGVPLLLTSYFLKISDVINDSVDNILRKVKK